jgi:hypothetical protein
MLHQNKKREADKSSLGASASAVQVVREFHFCFYQMQ